MVSYMKGKIFFSYVDGILKQPLKEMTSNNGTIY